MANLLQHSCLENPRDGGAWWAAVSGVAQSQTRLKRLSSSSSSSLCQFWCAPYTGMTIPSNPSPHFHEISITIILILQMKKQAQ